MRLPAILVSGLVLTEWVAAQKNVVNETALLELSPCVVRPLFLQYNNQLNCHQIQCSNQVLTTHACFPTDSCFCNDSLSKDLASCLASCSFSDQLAAIKFQASTCDRSVRSVGSIEALFFFLYAVATLFTIARVLSRLRRLGGAGFRWDDTAAVASYIPLTGVAICDHYAIRAGGGIDIWGLSVQNVHDFAYASTYTQHSTVRS